jgi:2-amino-4-hydroxy-6-hydroxymethyldihydropteridine diphosphokinase
MASRKSGRRVWIALGCNVPSAWGSPIHTLDEACLRLSRHGIRIEAVSSYFITASVGGGRQPDFVNGVVVARVDVPPASLLRCLKRVERAAGRRAGRHWGPRPLDLDIIDAGMVVGGLTRGRRPAGRIVLPHPEVHRRAFVLVPLLEVAPHWWHSRLKCPAKRLLQQRAVAVQRVHILKLKRCELEIAALRQALDL